jgi:uncharacterized membrane protein
MTSSDQSAPPSTANDAADCLADSSALITCIAHLYRGEMQRMTVWRTRLDTTTHWAIILTTGLTTFTLGTAAMPHYSMLLALAFNSIFMFIEGRRYQHLHHSKWRLALLEHNYFAPRLSRNARPVDQAWHRLLAADLQRPHFTIGLLMGVRLRLRRNYLILMYFITAVWLTKVFIHPGTPTSLGEFYGRLSVGELFPSWFVLSTASLFVASVTVLAATTPSEENLEQWSRLAHSRFVSTAQEELATPSEEH